MPDIYVTMDTYERHHAEQRQDHDRLVRLEGLVAKHTEQLQEGTGSFAEIRKSVEDAKPKAVSPFKVVGFLLAAVAPLLIAIMGFVWQAARYPTRDEFHGMQVQLSELQEQIRSVQTTQAVTTQKIEDVLKARRSDP